MGHNTPHRVALLMGQDLGYCRRVLSGILTYAEEQNLRWIYYDAPSDSRAVPLLKEWKPHGIIVHLADRHLARQLFGLGVPLVSTTHTLARPDIPTVDVDHEKVGIEAAKYFLSLGYRYFGYYGSESAMFSIKRRQGFMKVIEAAGFSVSGCHADFLPRLLPTQNWSELDKRAAAWLRRLTKPAAVLASNDIPARTLCRVCALANIQVPQEVAILGVDNDDSECRMCFPPLSSIETPTLKIGRNAARLLDGLIRKPSSKVRSIVFPPSMVIARESTDLRATLDARIRKALSHIEAHIEEGLNVPQICRSMNMSRRSAERLFSEKLRSTIHRQIQLAGINHAKKMLVQTDLSISDIAARSGFGAPRRFNRVFRAFENRSPSALRHPSVACHQDH